MFAFADDTIAAKTAAPIRVLGLRGYTDRFRSVSYAIRTRFANNKIFWAALCESPPEVSCDVTAECFILYSGIGGVGAGLGGTGGLGSVGSGLGGLDGLGGHH